MGISNQSPAILKKTSGAAYIGSTDGTVEERLAGIELSLSGTIDAVGNLQTDVTALQTGMMPKSGGTFTSHVTFNYDARIKSKDSVGNIFDILGVTTWNGSGESLEINGNSHNIGVSVNTGGPYTGTLANGRIVALSWNSSGVALAAGARVNGISTDNTLSGDSDELLCTQKAIKGYVDSRPYVYTVLESRVMDNTTSTEDFDMTGYDGYILLIDGVELAIADTMSVRLSDDGGSTFKTASYANALDNTTSAYSASAISVAGTTINATRPTFAKFEINDAVTDGACIGHYSVATNTASNDLRAVQGTFGHQSAANAIRVYTGSGNNFLRGNITLIGVTL